ncbi:MAG: HRDC domain protein [Deltaproteobacteria bacterium]|nr:MAG: HRDC domain protein [Deltaproteobacteria bacterium]
MKILMIKIFTLRFSEVLQGFDDEDVRKFMADKEIISVRDQFFIRNNIPYWSVMLEYNPVSEDKPLHKKRKSDKERKEEYRELLTDNSMPLFNYLREWRNERAKKGGLAPFVLFTNRQLAEIADKAPESLDKLATIEGVGKAKLENYGKEVLGIVRTVSQKKAEQSEKSGRKGDKKEQTGDKAKASPAPRETKETLLWDTEQKNDA